MSIELSQWLAACSSTKLWTFADVLRVPGRSYATTKDLRVELLYEFFSKVFIKHDVARHFRHEYSSEICRQFCVALGISPVPTTLDERAKAIAKKAKTLKFDPPKSVHFALYALSLKQLKYKARKYEIAGYHNASKDELVEKIIEHATTERNNGELFWGDLTDKEKSYWRKQGCDEDGWNAFYPSSDEESSDDEESSEEEEKLKPPAPVKGAAKPVKQPSSSSTHSSSAAGPAAFLAASTFQGKRDGYVFKKGAKGLGYYLEDLVAASTAGAAAAAPATVPHASLKPGDRVKVTASPKKLEKDFFACALKDRQYFDDGVKSALGRTMVLVELNTTGGWAKIEPAPSSNYKFMYTRVPITCLSPAAAIVSKPPAPPPFVPAPPPVLTATEKLAIHNYCLAKKLPAMAATIKQVAATTDGVEGWAAWKPWTQPGNSDKTHGAAAPPAAPAAAPPAAPTPAAPAAPTPAAQKAAEKAAEKKAYYKKLYLDKTFHPKPNPAKPATPNEAPDLSVDGADQSTPGKQPSVPFTSPKKGDNSVMELVNACWHFRQACGCKWEFVTGKVCPYLHLPTPSYPPELYPPAVMEAVTKAGQYAYERYFSKPYEPKPSSYTGSDCDYYCDFDAKLGVERPNHALAHAMRKAMLVPLLCKALKYEEALKDSGLLTAMMVAMIFEKSMRGSDIGYNDCVTTFLKYNRDSLDAFKKYSGGFDWFSTACVNALERMYTPAAEWPSEPIQFIFETAHGLDLFRCVDDEDKMERKVMTLCKAVGSVKAGMELVVAAETAIHRTGDRILFSLARLSERDHYDPDVFPLCNRSAADCISTIMGTPPAPPTPTPTPTPNVLKVLSDSKKNVGTPKGNNKAEPSSTSHTFATSTYLEKYNETRAPKMYHHLAAAVENVINAYGKLNKLSEAAVDAFFAELQSNAMYEGGVGEVAEAKMLPDLMVRMWTSADDLDGCEFCAIINHFIREDKDPAVMKDIAVIARTLNKHCVVRVMKAIEWPKDNKTFRCGALPRMHQSFFQKGKKFRTAMFVATSADRSISEKSFMGRLQMPPSAKQTPPYQEPVTWVFHFHKERRCLHVNYIHKNDGTVSNEEEFLFSPYSTFTVRETLFKSNPKGYHWPEGKGGKAVADGHEIHLDVSPDNSDEPEDLPIAPWA